MRPALLLSVLAVLSVSLLACGDDAELSDAAMRAVVEDGLLDESDLPSATWSIVDLDDPADDDAAEVDDPFEDVAECSDLEAVLGDADAVSDGAISRGRNFESNPSDVVAREVEATVHVFATSAEAGEAMSVVREFLTPDTFRPCLEAAFSQLFEEIGGSLTHVDVSSPEHLGPDGAGIAADLGLEALGFMFDIGFEVHFFAYDEVVADLYFVEMNSTLFQEHLEETLANFEDRIVAALDEHR